MIVGYWERLVISHSNYLKSKEIIVQLTSLVSSHIVSGLVFVLLDTTIKASHKTIYNGLSIKKLTTVNLPPEYEDKSQKEVIAVIILLLITSILMGELLYTLNVPLVNVPNWIYFLEAFALSLVYTDRNYDIFQNKYT